MKGPSSKVSRKLRANPKYGLVESEYLYRKGKLEGKYMVSGNTYVVFQDDTAATLREIDKVRQRIRNLKKNELSTR